ncbi:MAG TPA: hypothetical protein VLR89_07880 [Anaerolineaceae bacterium]|nr:hypothetical protein [Anaerolineaceae bacterium]
MQANYPFPYETFTAGGLEISFLSKGGPRIVGLRLNGSANLLAEVPGKIEETSHGTFHFVGGHRLWAAPEEKPLTYFPDDTKLRFIKNVDGFDLVGAPNTINGLQKEIHVTVDGGRGHVFLTHLLRNTGKNPINCAAWSITMLRPGGKAIFPTGTLAPNPDNLLPNKHLSFWPYNRADDPRVQYKQDHLSIDMSIIDPKPGKWGTFNARGWMAYWLDGIVFCKNAANTSAGSYPDFGCNTETYICDTFIELESLGLMQQILPGAELIQNETWTLREGPEISSAELLSGNFVC